MTAISWADGVKEALAPVRDRLRAVRDAGADRLRPDLPPRRIRKTISPLWLDFEDSGANQVEFLAGLAGLRPGDKVLDVGCGVGRVALPLRRYLDATGRYEGFDISPSCIEWCTTNIEAKDPRFHFQVADVSTSDLPGAVPPSEYTFPFDEDTFDVVYVGSVFTHLLPEGAQRYLAEAARTLRPGGRVVSTWLLFNDETQRLIPQPGLERFWKHDHGIYRTAREDIPEVKVAYEETAARGFHRTAGLTVAEPIRVDVTYCPTRIPADRAQGLHLYYSHCIIAVATS